MGRIVRFKEEVELMNIHKADQALAELTKESLKLRQLKARGKFSLQQAEYSLKRLTQTIINIYRFNDIEVKEVEKDG